MRCPSQLQSFDTVPNVVGLDLATAKQRLKAANLHGVAEGLGEYLAASMSGSPGVALGGPWDDDALVAANGVEHIDRQLRT